MKGGCRLKRRKKLSKTLLSESSSDSSGEELSKEYLDESRRTKRAKVDLTSDSSEEVSFSPKLLGSLIDNIFGLFFQDDHLSLPTPTKGTLEPPYTQSTPTRHSVTEQVYSL